MSEASGTEASGSSFSSSAGGSSLASDTTDTRALNALQDGPDGEASDDLGANNRTVQEGVFATLYTLTKNRALDTSLRIAIFRVVFEFLQFFRVAFNFSFPWFIDRSLWIFKAIEWILFRSVVVQKGYSTYTTIFYLLAAVVLATLLLTIWIALVLKGSDTVNIWLKRLIGLLQLVALVVYVVAWPVILDYMVFLFDCDWTLISQGLPAKHVYFQEQSCTSMPHLAHMLFSAVVIVVLISMVLLMSMGTCDMNPLNVSRLSSSDAVTSIKMLILKVVFVIIATMIDQMGNIQAGIMTVAMFGVVYYLFDGVPYYSKLLNLVWGGLWLAMLDVSVLLLILEVLRSQQADQEAFDRFITQVLLYTVFPAVALGAFLMWLRLQQLQRLTKHLRNAMNVCKASITAHLDGEDGARTAGSAVALMALGDLKKVYRFRDVRQVFIALRDMRHWDEDGVPEPEAMEYGEFVIKCGLARMSNSPALLVVYANFMIESRKDGQAARTQLQLAQKSSPSLLDNYNIYVTQQLAKQLKRDGDGLDLMGYVEFQRNFLACVQSHKQALMAQRAFWNSLLRDTVSFKDLQANIQAMEAAEQRATAVYRRVMERYPGNGKIMKVYARFLEFVRNEPGAASRFYEAALKQGTTESLLALTAAEGGAAGLAAAGQVDEKTDGLIVINAQGIIMMCNSAAVTMFGYQKGELEGKNVSILVPPAFSAHHDSFIQRYLETGQPRILNKVRAVVAVHKVRQDRSMMPVSLCTARLSGIGSDTLFIGLVRRDGARSLLDSVDVKFWASASGIIMCADISTADAFGIPAGEVVGRAFSNLCTDVEGVNRFMAQAAESSEATNPSARPSYRTKVLHAFLAPVEVELYVEYGGALEDRVDFRCLIVHVRVLAEPAAVMVVDRKGRIMHATAKLANLLGHPLANMTKMELNAMLPQPFCQMHGAWFKDPPQRIPATSCRAGGVVHLLAANGTKVPVTLKITSKEDAENGHVTYVVQATKATEDQRLDQQRMLLTVNHKGVILGVNQGLPKSLYGFEGTQLVQQPLSTIIDVFSDWKAGCGEELSLLEVLVSQMLAANTDGAGKAGSHNMICDSWRVGVHRPVHESGHCKVATTADTHGSSLLHALQPNKVQAACMKLSPIVQDTQDLLMDAEAADATPVLQIALHRSDALTAIVELDKELRVGRADDAAGLMFGVHNKQLLHKAFPKLVGLSDIKTFEDLLGTAHDAAKKGAMKTTSIVSRAGSIRRVTATHLGDGKPLELQIQGMLYKQAGRCHKVVRLQLMQPVSAAMDTLLALKDGSTVAALAEPDDSCMPGVNAHGAGSLPRGSSTSGSSITADDHAGAGPAVAVSGVGAPVLQPSKPSDRIRDWVRQASHLDPAEEEDAISGEPPSPRHRHPTRQLAQGYDDHHEADAYHGGQVSVHVKLTRSAGKVAKSELARKAQQSEGTSSDDGSMDHSQGLAMVDKQLDEAGSDVDSSFAGSMADGISEAAGSGIDTSVTATGMAHDEELAVDMRRVKRLKKLSRMVTSSLAQAATQQWKWRTLVLLAIILAAHVACFAVIASQLDSRHANAVTTVNIALSVSAASQAVLRINFLQKCATPTFKDMWVCQPDLVKDYGARLAANTAKFRNYHHSLYLGGAGLEPFKDPRLVKFWTYQQLPETQYYQVTLDNTPTFTNSTRSLWEMGNNMLNALSDVYLFRDTWGATMDQQPAWQYAYNNYPDSVWHGYAWSLDTFVDYTWQDLTKLSTTIIILLVVEAVLVQMSCMVYEFILLHKCNTSHMRLFSVFLALPSATVRFMVRRPMLVDDGTNDDVDDDDVELVDGAAATNSGAPPGPTEATTGEEGVMPADKKKSVRMAAEETENEQGKADLRLKGSANGRTSTRKASAAVGKRGKQQPVGWLATAWKRLHKHLLGWMDPKFKRNGKRLSPSMRIVWHFMGPLLLWVAAVVVIYGVSYSNLQGLQAPLASLDLSAHVLYRLTKTRLVANMLAFSTDDANNAKYRAQLKTEVDLLRSEYRMLMYGGTMLLQAEVSFEPQAPAAVFEDKSISDMFFTTTACLRLDQTTCFTPGDEFYTLTHSGLDAQINRYLDEMSTFSNVPDALALANHPSYEFAVKVTGHDTYEGLQQACQLFVDFTLSRLNAVKQLHIILLVISLCCMVLFVLALYRPYIKALRRDTKAVVNMMSQLPAEVDVEGHVKAIVLGITKNDAGSRSMEGPPGGPSAMQLQPYGAGMGVPGMGMGPGTGAGTGAGWSMGGGPGNGMQGGGWFGRRNSSQGPSAQFNDPNLGSYGMHPGWGMQRGSVV